MGKLLTALGNPPVCTSFAFKKYLEKCLAYWETAAAATRTTVYYFSQSGDDTTGNGSLATPWRTLAKAQATHDAWTQSSNGLELRFKRGDVWRGETGLTITKNYVTLSDYGDGTLRKPLFTKFQAVYDHVWGTSISRSDAHTNVYSRAEAGSVVWLREENDTEAKNIYAKVASIAACNALPGSWCVIASVLYIRPRHGVSPSDVQWGGTGFEVVLSNTDGGIQLSGTNTIVKRIRVDGYSAGHNGTPYPMIATAGDGVFYECEAYYGGYHEIGAVSNATDYAFIRCRAGMDTTASSGTVYVTYSTSGSHEGFFYDCVTVAGTLKASPRTAGSSGYGAGIYGHCGSGTAGLVIAWKCRNDVGRFQIGTANHFDNLPTVTALTDARGFVVEDLYDTYDQETLYGEDSQAWAIKCFAGNMVRLNSVIKINATETTNFEGDLALSSTWGTSGLGINCRVEFGSFCRLTYRSQRVYAVQSNAELSGKFAFCDFVWTTLTRQPCMMLYLVDVFPADVSRVANVEAKNCIFRVGGVDGSTFAPGLNNDATKMVANAYIGKTHGTTGYNGYSNDLYKITPDASSVASLVTSYPQTILGHTVLFDRFWKKRKVAKPTIGSVEYLPRENGLSESEMLVIAAAFGSRSFVANGDTVDFSSVDITLIDDADLTNIYYGGLLSGAWKVNRYNRTTYVKTSATISNNGGVANLAAAWTARTSLTYE